MIMFDKLKRWMNHISDIKNNGGGTKKIPNVDLRLNLLDSTHQKFTTSFVMVGVWPTSISETSLAYKNGDNNALTLTASFKYQYCYRDDNFDTSADPLRP
jgi:hypothetical protein